MNPKLACVYVFVHNKNKNLQNIHSQVVLTHGYKHKTIGTGTWQTFVYLRILIVKEQYKEFVKNDYYICSSLLHSQQMILSLVQSIFKLNRTIGQTSSSSVEHRFWPQQIQSMNTPRLSKSSAGPWLICQQQKFLLFQ